MHNANVFLSRSYYDRKLAEEQRTHHRHLYDFLEVGGWDRVLKLTAKFEMPRRDISAKECETPKDLSKVLSHHHPRVQEAPGCNNTKIRCKKKNQL